MKTTGLSMSNTSVPRAEKPKEGLLCTNSNLKEPGIVLIQICITEPDSNRQVHSF